METQPSAAQLEESARTLREMVYAGERGSSTQLPPLKQTQLVPQTWIEWLNGQIKHAFEWVSGLFPKKLNLPEYDLREPLKILAEAAAAVLVLWILWTIFNKLFSLSVADSRIGFEGGIEYLPDDDLINGELEAAIEAGHFGQAARLRWRLFLRRHNQPSSLTVREFLARRRFPELDEVRAYRLMFHQTDPSSEDYRSWDGLLKGLEA
jgi:hypothetical protein